MYALSSMFMDISQNKYYNCFFLYFILFKKYFIIEKMLEITILL